MITEEVIRIFKRSNERLEEMLVPDISGALMSYSNSNKFEENQYIYTGEEKIPFNERDTEYQQIFKDEFL
ncbi:MAG: hypothetical protein ACFFA0_14270 [Promethearchaeota archaeon]